MLIWMYNTLFFRDKIEQLVCNLWDINSELFSPTAVKLQGRATFLTLSNPSCHHTYYESMFLSSTLWRLALWCWGWDSAHHLFSPPAGFCWVPPTGDARGDWKAGGGKGDVVLLSFFFFYTTNVTPAMSLHPLNGDLFQSPTLSLAHPELASSSHIRGTRIVRAESPSLRSEYQLSGVLLPTSETINTPISSLDFLSCKGEKLPSLVLPWIPFCLSVLQHHQTRSLYLIFSAKILR